MVHTDDGVAVHDRRILFGLSELVISARDVGHCQRGIEIRQGREGRSAVLVVRSCADNVLRDRSAGSHAERFDGEEFRYSPIRRSNDLRNTGHELVTHEHKVLTVHRDRAVERGVNVRLSIIVPDEAHSLQDGVVDDVTRREEAVEGSVVRLPRPADRMEAGRADVREDRGVGRVRGAARKLAGSDVDTGRQDAGVADGVLVAERTAVRCREVDGRAYQRDCERL